MGVDGTSMNSVAIGSDGTINNGRYVFLGGPAKATAGQNVILLGNGPISAGAHNGIFVYSNQTENFMPQKDHAFYVNSQMGVTSSGKMPQVTLDIEK